MRCAYPTYKLIRPVYPGKYVLFYVAHYGVGICLKVFTESYLVGCAALIRPTNLSDLFILESMFYFTLRTMALVFACRYFRNRILSDGASLIRPTNNLPGQKEWLLASCLLSLAFHRRPQSLRHPLINALALPRRHRGNHTVKLRRNT